MLTADLVETRRRGEQLFLRPFTALDEERALALADGYLAVVRAAVGRERAYVLEACREIPVPAADRRLAAGLQKLVLDGCLFEEATAADPVGLRDTVFARATQIRQAMGPGQSFDRAVVLAEVAESLQLTPEDIERTLYADLPDAHLLRAVDLPGPRTLVARYQAGRVQAVLLRALEVRLTVTQTPPAAVRALFAKLKFLRLLARIEVLPPRPKKAGSKDAGEGPAGYLITIDGPMSLFESVTKYGLELALAYPAFAACGRFSLEADLRWGKERRPLRFAVCGQGETSKVGEAPAPTPEVRKLLEDLAQNSKATAWKAAASQRLVSLPGRGVLVPDLELLHRPSGRTVWVEVLGFWSREAVWKRIEWAPHLPHPTIFAVGHHLRVGEAALPPETPGALYVYRRTLSATALLARAQALLQL